MPHKRAGKKKVTKKRRITSKLRKDSASKRRVTRGKRRFR